mgnify:CR=1 FL=1
MQTFYDNFKPLCVYGAVLGMLLIVQFWGLSAARERYLLFAQQTNKTHIELTKEVKELELLVAENRKILQENQRLINQIIKERSK